MKFVILYASNNSIADNLVFDTYMQAFDWKNNEIKEGKCRNRIEDYSIRQLKVYKENEE